MSNLNRHKQQGIALVTVLGTALVILALLMVITNLTIRSSRVSSRDINATRLVQLADGYSDWGRLMLADNYKKSKLGLDSWLNKISSDRNTKTPATININPMDPKVSVLAGKHPRTMDGINLRWEIKNVSKARDNNAWVEIAATAEDTSGNNLQTVVRTVQFGSENIFKLALLTKKVDCMFCHLTVQGDVGSIGFLRPGWGEEKKSGGDSGKGSEIRGDVYVADEISKDGAANTINGATATGKINTKYQDDPLPIDGNKKAVFPGLDRDLAASAASGTISGGTIRTVGPSQNLGQAQTVGNLTNTFDGNLILEGTDANPIVLDGDIYVSGDVIIKGVVKGRGAIYAGRNMYVAGKLTNKNKADKPGQGVCASISDREACAVKNIAAGKDETRLSAGNNIILGDYTEQDSAGQLQSRADRQSADYFRAQFGLYPGNTRYVRKGNGEELEYDSGAGVYLDQMGREVPSSEVKAINGVEDPYRTLMAPGAIDGAGNFNPWMTDAQYQTLLGRENIPANTWRSEVNPNQYAGSDTDKINAIVAELEKAGLPAGSPETLAIATALVGGSGGNFQYSGTDLQGKPVTGSVNLSGPNKDGVNTLRVAVNEARAYKTEVTELDAFLYANGRIAGKLSPRGGYINGGMIAREIGVLAPGKNQDNAWWVPSADRAAYTNCSASRPTDTVADAANTGTDCNYAINYDYRLRNGGYGFNLYKGRTGTTFEWQLDLDGTKKVQP